MVRRTLSQGKNPALPFLNVPYSYLTGSGLEDVLLKSTFSQIRQLVRSKNKLTDLFGN